MTMRRLYYVFALAVLFCANAAPAEKDDLKSGPQAGDPLHVYTPRKIQWQKGPASIPPGAEFAVLEGDPAKDGPFVMRLKLPDGFRIPPHTHPKPERLTVISGTFYIGMGDKFDPDKGTPMPAGTFGTWAPGMKHFVWAKGETVVQLHGVGPWVIRYLNPSDDPRNAKR
jgi:quercetin dioxygenase-like cupin family protein